MSLVFQTVGELAHEMDAQSTYSLSSKDFVVPASGTSGGLRRHPVQNIHPVYSGCAIQDKRSQTIVISGKRENWRDSEWRNSKEICTRFRGTTALSAGILPGDFADRTVASRLLILQSPRAIDTSFLRRYRSAQKKFR
jgi:hypothetical protein